MTVIRQWNCKNSAGNWKCQEHIHSFAVRCEAKTKDFARLLVLSHTEFHNKIWQRKTNCHFDSGFDNFGNRSRYHITLTFKISSVNRNDTAEEYWWCKHHHCVNWIRRLDNIDVNKAESYHKCKTGKSHYHKERNWHLVNLAHIFVSFFCYTLCCQYFASHSILFLVYIIDNITIFSF